MVPPRGFQSCASMTDREWLNWKIADLQEQIAVEKTTLDSNPSNRDARFYLHAKENLLASLEQKLTKLL